MFNYLTRAINVSISIYKLLTGFQKHAKIVYEDQTHTIGVEFGAKNINCGGKKIKLQIWDT